MHTYETVLASDELKKQDTALYYLLSSVNIVYKIHKITVQCPHKLVLMDVFLFVFVSLELRNQPDSPIYSQDFGEYMGSGANGL